MTQTIQNKKTNRPSINPAFTGLIGNKFLPLEARSIFLHQALKRTAAQGGGLYHSPIQTAARSGTNRIDRYIHIGPESDHEPLKLAVFAGIQPGDQWSALAAATFLLDLEDHPSLSTGVHLYVYPVVNEANYQTEKKNGGDSEDLYLEIWQNSENGLAYLIERELSVIQFHGVITLLGLNHLSGISGQIFGAGATLHESLLLPVLQKLHPWGAPATKDDWVASQRLSLTAGGYLKPRPFEVAIKIPSDWSAQSQVEAGSTALFSLLENYRHHIAQAHSI